MIPLTAEEKKSYEKQKKKMLYMQERVLYK